MMIFSDPCLTQVPNIFPMQLPWMSGSFMPRKMLAISAGDLLPFSRLRAEQIIDEMAV